MREAVRVQPQQQRRGQKHPAVPDGDGARLRGEEAAQLRARARAGVRAGQGADLRPRGGHGRVEDDTRDEVSRLRDVFTCFGGVSCMIW